VKHPFHKLSKKTRNIISGIMVGFASIYAVASYYKVPQSEINQIFLSTGLLVLGIMLLAITGIALVKGILKIFSLATNSKNK
jgi:hypothetical protein